MSVGIVFPVFLIMNNRYVMLHKVMNKNSQKVFGLFEQII